MYRRIYEVEIGDRANGSMSFVRVEARDKSAAYQAVADERELVGNVRLCELLPVETSPGKRVGTGIAGTLGDAAMIVVVACLVLLGVVVMVGGLFSALAAARYQSDNAIGEAANLLGSIQGLIVVMIGWGISRAAFGLADRPNRVR